MTQANSYRYDELGQRVTDCCGVYSTYMDDGTDMVLCCKACYEEVGTGQGDGTQFRPGVTMEAYFDAAFPQDALPEDYPEQEGA